MRSKSQHRKNSKQRHKAATNYKKCGRCGKRVYQSQEAAMQVIVTTKGRAGVRTYYEHGNWHLSGH